MGGFEFEWRVLGNFSRAFERGLRLAELPRQILQPLIVASFFRALIRRFDGFLRTNREYVEDRKRHRQPHGPVGPVRRQALAPSKKLPGRIQTASASVDRGLQIKL